MSMFQPAGRHTPIQEGWKKSSSPNTDCRSILNTTATTRSRGSSGSCVQNVVHLRRELGDYRPRVTLLIVNQLACNEVGCVPYRCAFAALD